MVKGKNKTILRIVILVMVLAMSCLCVGLGTLEPVEKIYSATLIGSEEFSAVDSNHIVLSVEKVGVISTDDSLKYYSSQTLSGNYDSYATTLYDNNGNELNSVLTQSGNYYFTYIDGTRYVVSDGEFVMLENKIDDGDYYYNSALGLCYTDQSAVSPYNMAEAIMVSFGHYIYDSTSGEATLNTDASANAGIEYLNVVVYRNGERITQDGDDINVVPGLRQVGNYYDFVYLIPQISGHEGYYEFQFTYMYGNYTYSQTFGFYLLYQTSYTGETVVNGNTYTSLPTLTKGGEILGTNSSGIYQYYLGKTSTDYPTLVYDYTKYKLSYTLIANNTTSTYDYTFSTTTAATGSVTASLICSVTTSGVTTTTTYFMDNYSASATNNLAVIMLTEMGTYTFSFEYIYTGYNASNASEMNLTIEDISMIIYGFELKYSKANYSEAQMRYITVSENANDKVDLVIPNGYQYGTTPTTNTALQLVYSLDSSSSLRVGSVVSSQDACVNLDSNDSADMATALAEYFYAWYCGETPNLTTDVTTWLSGISYQKTNQGSLWLSTNDSFVLSDASSNEAGSFYFYSTSAISFTESTDTPVTYTTGNSLSAYTNTTSFNKVGYYLVFIKVKPSSSTSDGDPYYQIFAFQYTADTQSVEVNTEDGTVVGSGDYTNQNVVVSWTEPGIFEREITVKYYSVAGSYLSRTDLLKLTGTTISNGAVLGENISSGSGASFVIELVSEGKSASYRTFTIDREDIKGVMAYAVDTSYALDGTLIYKYKTDTSGSYIDLSTAITDSLATLYWNTKNSGATIKVTYTYTPFSKTATIEPGAVNTSVDWYVTNYILGTTTGNFSISSTTLGADIDYSNVLFEQGIYLFTLTDEAGNSCKYMLIIDNTEAYFKVYDGTTTQYLTADSIVSSTDVDITVSAYKAIKLITSGAESTESKLGDLYSLINALSVSNSSTAVTNATSLGYFSGSYTNLQNLASLFAITNSEVYLIVRNNTVTSYDDKTQKDSSLSITVSTSNTSNNTINMVYTASTSTSMIRYFYLIGANQSYTSALNSNSYICVEINKDNSQGTVYYSNDTLTLSNIGNAERLYTGSDTTNSDGNVLEYGIYGAHATSDNYVAFTWVFGDFTIESITYTYYSLNLSGTSSAPYYYYDASATTTGTIYSLTSGYASGASVSTDGKTGFALINVSNGMTAAGLYVITRTYSESFKTGVESSGDKMTLNYYFIVDRNGIIESGTINNGGYIYIGLLEDETSYNSFSSYGNEQGTVYYSATGSSEIISYNVYFSTNKLPATVNVPTAKYFDGNTGSYYYSGRLTLTLYFVDKYGQLTGTAYKNTGGLKLFEVLISDEDFDSKTGYYVVDLASLISTELQGLFINGDNDTDWLCLPGDYVLVISDTIESSSGAHERVIGFRISYNEDQMGPTTDVYSVSVKDNTVTSSANVASLALNSYKLTTSEEYVKIELPAYVTDSYQAQVDTNYLVVTQVLNGTSTTYIDYEYIYRGGYNLSVSSDYVVINADGSKTIYLNTLLRDSDGNIISENLTNNLYYIITIRYVLSNTDSNTAYLGAYYYYDANGNKVTYYDQTYYVYIDRVAPTNNIANLESADTLVAYYVAEDGVDLFEANYYDNKTSVYFVNQYTNYYLNNKSLSEIYALRITLDTSFDSTDIETIYYRVIDPTSAELTLPATNLSGYTSISIGTIVMAKTYSALISGLTVGQYYEVLEFDSAGNVTQYVIFCDSATGDYQSLNVPIYVTIKDTSITTGDYTLSTSGSGNLTIFSVSASETKTSFSATTTYHDMFYHFELTNAVTGAVYTYQTNMATSFTDTAVGQAIAYLINGAGYGTYTLKIYSRYATASYSINYYDESAQVVLNIEKLVTNNTQVTLSGANVTIDNVFYYLKTIEITGPDGTITTYVYKTDTKGYYVGVYNPEHGDYDTSGDQLYAITNLTSGTYMIYAIDTFGEEYYYVFNTSGKAYYSINFGSTGTDPYYYLNGIYYAYSQAIVYFDTSLYSAEISYSIGSLSGTVSVGSSNTAISYDGSAVIDFTDVANGYIYIYPYFGSSSLGGKLSVTITLSPNNSQSAYNREYDIVIDTTTNAVSLRDNSSGSAKSTEVSLDADYTKLTTTSAVSSGNMTLTWSSYSNDYFYYTYTIYELKNDGSFVSTSLTNATSYSISTGDDSTGIYNFVIAIYTAEGQYLGNKVYTFSVQPKSSLAYYVYLNGVISANSTFTFAELNDLLTSDQLSAVKAGLGLDTATSLPTTNNDLYVTTATPSVLVSEDQGYSYKSYICSSVANSYTFTIYRIYNSTNVEIYIGLLVMAESSSLINSLQMTTDSGSSSITGVTTLNYTYCESVGTNYVLNFTHTSANALTDKNIILLDVYFNDTFVKTVTPTSSKTSSTITYTYTIEGNGTYSFVFRDLAGNTHAFDYNSENVLYITILREIPVTLNGLSIIDYAYFNGKVVLSLTSPGTYDYGSISLTATLNGSSYSYTRTSSYAYTFSGYGTFKIKVSAKYNGTEISKTIIFTIINENEARSSIDFTNINEYEITKVLNASGRDVTDAFISLVSSSSDDGMLLTYDEIIANSSALGVSSGKQTFTVTYLVADGIYEDREVTFTFTMNDEVPTIESTITSGDSTTKGFTITYNAGIIYDQVGEAYLYINDELICVINASSSSSISTYTISQKTNGAGDYYVRLVSTSGNIITSFKVEVKEPLNTWAIIIIVVVTALIVGVIITIILLRTKMRVR